MTSTDEKIKVDGAGGAQCADYGVIISPVITEKSSRLSGDPQILVLRVARGANKNRIKEAVERVFKTQVDSVQTCNYIGKVKQTARSIGRRPSFKKAYVTLTKGSRVEIIEGM